MYAVASITKQFVGAAILKLASEGKLQLDDDISKFVPDLPMVRGPVTLRQLLHHTSGISAFGRLPGRNANRLDYSREEWLAAMRDIYKDRAPAFSPGDAWAYTDVNYALLGFAVEKVSGRTLWEYLREHFFAPLGMTSTARCDPGAVFKHRAEGYVRNDKKAAGVVVAPFVSPTLAFGSHGLCSSAMDLLKWQRALVEDRVPGVRYARMTQTGTLNDGRGIDYGFGLVVWPLGSERMVFHTGGMPVYNSFLADRHAVGTRPSWPAGAAEPDRHPRGARTLRGHVRVGSTQGGRAGEQRAVRSHSERERLVPLHVLHLSRQASQQGDGEFVVGWEPESRLTFHVTGDRATAVVLRYGGRTVELARELVPSPGGG